MGSDDLFKKRKRAREERKRETREPKADSFFIVTEGMRTEPLYFEGLAQRIRNERGGNIEVKTTGLGMGTRSLIEEAAAMLNRSGRVYQHVWVVFDKDDFPDFDEAIALAEDYGFEVAWTNQAFEYWLYCHFEYCDSALSRDEWCDKLSEKFKTLGIKDGRYEKSMGDIYDVITEYGDEDFAIGTAKSILERHGDIAPSKCDPATTVFELVERMRSFLH